MSCQVTRDDLDALVYGELTTERAREIETHAAGCDDCGPELAWLRTERGALRERAGREPELPAQLWASIEQRIDADAADSAPWWRAMWPGRREQARWFGFGLATAAAAAAAVFALTAPDQAPSGAVALAGDAGVRAAADANAPEPDPGDKMAEAQRAVDEAEAAHLGAIAALEAVYLERRDQLDPVVAARYDDEFRKTRATIDSARKDAGDDIIARVRLLDAYSAHRRSIQSVVRGLQETP